MSSATKLVPLTLAHPRTPMEVALDAVGDRHRLLIVWHLFWGAKPFCDLMRSTPGITRKALRRALSDMESRGIVRRDVRFGTGRRADYALTPAGESLKLIVGSLYEWGLALQRGATRRRDVAPSGAGPWRMPPDPPNAAARARDALGPNPERA